MDIYIMWLALEPGDPKIPWLFNDLKGTRTRISPARAKELVKEGVLEIR